MLQLNLLRHKGKSHSSLPLTLLAGAKTALRARFLRACVCNKFCLCSVMAAPDMEHLWNVTKKGLLAGDLSQSSTRRTMNFELDEELQLFQKETHEWVERECPKAWARELELHEHDW